jgi:hypothetical protein
MHSWKRNAYRTLVEIPEGKNHSEYPDVDGLIILKRILKELDGRVLNLQIIHNAGNFST